MSTCARADRRHQESPPGDDPRPADEPRGSSDAAGSDRQGGGAGLFALGYQGFGNLGDEAILTGIEAILDQSGLTIDALVCGPRPDAVVGFLRARRLPSPRLLPTWSAIRALRSSRGLVLAGGGLLHDHWPTVIPRYVAWILLARLLRRRVVWIGVGVGPIRRRTHRFLARFACRLAALALVRDSTSAALLGGERRRVRVIPDPALFNPPPPPVASDSDPALAIIVRAPVPADGDRAPHLAATLVEVAEAAFARGWRPTFMTMAGDADRDFTTRLLAVAAERGVSAEMRSLGPTPRAAVTTLAACRGVVTVRLHGLLLAAVAGVPAVAVAYDAKVNAAARQLGLGDLVVDLASLTTDDIMSRLELAGEPARRVKLAAEIDRVRSQLPDVAAAVDHAIRGS